MSNFVGIPKAEDGNGYFLLNLDLIATAHVNGTRGLSQLGVSR